MFKSLRCSHKNHSVFLHRASPLTRECAGQHQFWEYFLPRIYLACSGRQMVAILGVGAGAPTPLVKSSPGSMQGKQLLLHGLEHIRSYKSTCFHPNFEVNFLLRVWWLSMFLVGISVVMDLEGSGDTYNMVIRLCLVFHTPPCCEAFYMVISQEATLSKRQWPSFCTC